jgi:hypothetical protein
LTIVFGAADSAAPVLKIIAPNARPARACLPHNVFIADSPPIQRAIPVRPAWLLVIFAV